MKQPENSGRLVKEKDDENLIYIKPLTGTVIPVNVNSGTTWGLVKTYIQKANEIPVATQRIIVQGKVVNNEDIVTPFERAHLVPTITLRQEVPNNFKLPLTLDDFPLRPYPYNFESRKEKLKGIIETILEDLINFPEILEIVRKVKLDSFMPEYELYVLFRELHLVQMCIENPAESVDEVREILKTYLGDIWREDLFNARYVQHQVDRLLTGALSLEAYFKSNEKFNEQIQLSTIPENGENPNGVDKETFTFNSSPLIFFNKELENTDPKRNKMNKILDDLWENLINHPEILNIIEPFSKRDAMVHLTPDDCLFGFFKALHNAQNELDDLETVNAIRELLKDHLGDAWNENSFNEEGIREKIESLLSAPNLKYYSM